MQITETKKGELFMISATLLWSLFPVISILSIQSISPILTAAWSTTFAAILFGFVLLAQKKIKETFIHKAWKEIIIGSLLIGVVFYGLTFYALQFTTAGNASLIFLTEILFTFLFFKIWKKEEQSSWHIGGAIFMTIGAGIILMPNANKEIFSGDLLILLGFLFTPFANSLQQKARKQVSAESLIFLRSIISIPFLFVLSFIFENPDQSNKFVTALPFLILNGVLIFGISKYLFFEAIHRIPISKTISFGAIAPAFTLILAYFFLGEQISLQQIAGFIPIFIGVILLTRK